MSTKTKLTGVPSDTGERRFREIVYFADRDQAYRLTEEALRGAGFEVERMSPDNQDDGVKARQEWRASGRPTTFYGSRPELYAVHQDPETGNRVELGLTVNYAGINWPYDWTGRAVRPIGSSAVEELAQTGNHDNNQGELHRSLMGLLGCAHFDVPRGTYLGDMPGYAEWEASTREALDPILGREEV